MTTCFCSRLFCKGYIMASSNVPQHKRLAMGQRVGFKDGGSLPAPKVLKSGTPMSPITKAKRDNGVPGFKKGGQ